MLRKIELGSTVRNKVTLMGDEESVVRACAAIKEGLSQQQENILEITSAMESFELKILQLEDTMKPIRDLTELLLLGQVNIQKSVSIYHVTN